MTTKKICGGWSAVQWFNSCYVESQHLKSIEVGLIIFKLWMPFPRRKQNSSLGKKPNTCALWIYQRNKCSLISLIQTMKDMWLPSSRWPEGCKEKAQLVFWISSAKTFYTNYMSSEANAHSSAVLCWKKNTVNTGQLFFVLVTEFANRRRRIFPFKTSV